MSALHQQRPSSGIDPAFRDTRGKSSVASIRSHASRCGWERGDVASEMDDTGDVFAVRAVIESHGIAMLQLTNWRSPISHSFAGRARRLTCGPWRSSSQGFPRARSNIWRPSTKRTTDRKGRGRLRRRGGCRNDLVTCHSRAPKEPRDWDTPRRRDGTAHRTQRLSIRHALGRSSQASVATVVRTPGIPRRLRAPVGLGSHESGRFDGLVRSEVDGPPEGTPRVITALPLRPRSRRSGTPIVQLPARVLAEGFGPTVAGGLLLQAREEVSVRRDFVRSTACR